MFLLLYLCSFAICFEFNVLIDLITWYSQSGNKINHVLFKFVFTLFRSSHRRCFIKKAVLKNFAIFTWKHLCWSLCVIKLQTFRSLTFLKRDSNTDVCEIFKNTYFEEHLRTAASVYSEDLLKYNYCVIKNMLPESF